MARARAAKEALGERVFVLGHHYQRDEVIQFADVTGDSFKLARDAAGAAGGGVHRLLRRALHGRVGRHPHRARRRRWSCPTWPPAARWPTWPGSRQVEDAWDALTDAGIADVVVPVTYMNSSADIKAFCGRNGGAVCTSSNAEVALEWAFAQKGRTPRCCSCPTSTSAATPRCCKMGMTLDDCVVWDPRQPDGGLTAEQLRRRADDPVEGPLLGARPLLRRRRRRAARDASPASTILVHPECTHEVVLKADLVGSTEFIIKTIEAAPAGLGVGDRHRAQPGQAAGRRAPRQADRRSSTRPSATARR